MRATLILILAVVAMSGCKSAELAVVHPGTGIQFVAKLEAQDPAPSSLEPHYMPMAMTSAR